MTGDWLPAAGRALGGPVRVIGREPAHGGYASGSVERVELDVGGRAVPVVVKQASPVEVAALRARAVVRGIGPLRLLAVAGDRIVLTHHAGTALADGAPVPDAVWAELGGVHAHWRGRRPRGVPVVDRAYWRGLCDRTLVAVRGALARTGDDAFTVAEQLVSAWRDDPRIARALATLPRTLVHGDPHRGNILTGPDGAVLIDWGNARVAPAALDLAVLRAQGAQVPAALAATTSEQERDWADVHANVQYLGFACDHLGAPRVREMVAAAEGATARLAACG
ncbi:aminoglycoside phosphotransferase family protein [Pseudonocardia sp.]|uniref:aminoglycoside phosphotransferase family protein n=1 Tax=Pseudonocardia sp. TaxID=60912 RepID=UPI00262DC383|nr:aminoglycoside phosphotransferase family protein [Pseudonocardia sp.]